MSIVRDGYPYIGIPFVLGIAFLLLGRNPFLAVAGWAGIIISLFCLFFFRDPSRTIAGNPGEVLSPCDGTVMQITEENGMKVIRVFLSVFNVHLQRSPVDGVVKKLEYRPGKFLPAMNAQAHAENEQNIFTIETPRGDVIVKQIAGILARRVVAWVKTGDRVALGQKIGMIKFSSQVDLYVPQSCRVEVALGKKVIGGRTVIGRFEK